MARRRKQVLIRQQPDRPLTEAEQKLADEAVAYAQSDQEYTQYHEMLEDDLEIFSAPDVAQALASLTACGDAQRAASLLSQQPTQGPFLGVSAALIEDQVRLWRSLTGIEDRVELARGLWLSGVYEAKVAAVKLLTQARISPDAAVWDLLISWVTEAEGALADLVCAALARRLAAEPVRLQQITPWAEAESPSLRRAALAVTLPFTRQNHPTAEEAQIRAQGLQICAHLAQERGLQGAVTGWLSGLAKHDPVAVRSWLEAHGPALGAKPSAALLAKVQPKHQ